MKKHKGCRKCGVKMDHLIKDSMCGNCMKTLQKVKSFKEWVELDGVKIVAKTIKKYK